MSPKVYLETTVISYYTARPSRDVIRLAHQELTRGWWERRRGAFALYVSEFVVRESAAGDPSAAQDRLSMIADIPVLTATENAQLFARHLLTSGLLPARAAVDAAHIAVAAVHGVDYLLTWNCKHIANAETRPRIERACRTFGYEPPQLCTPEELMGEENEHDDV